MNRFFNGKIKNPHFRLVRGDGEIMEEIVSEARHKEINRTATAGDGASFQANLSNKMKS